MSEDMFNEEDNSSMEMTSSMEEDFRQIEALAKMDSSFANSDEYKDLMISMENSRAANSSKNNQSAGAEEEEEYEEDEEEQEDEEDENDIFGLSKTSPKAKEITLNFEAPEEMLKFLKGTYGINDAGKFFSSVDAWRQQAQEGADVRRDFDAISADLQAMPSDIKQAVQMWANGEDHTKALEQTQRLDFSSDFGNQDVESLVQHYLEDEYEELVYQLENDDIDSDEFEDKMILLAKTTKRIFNEEKRALETEREQFAVNQKNQYQMMKKTALLSVENLSKAYPNFSKSEIAKIRTVLVEGKIDDLFMNADGTYSEDAAENVAYALHGKKMLDSVRKIAERKGESSANQRIVDLSPKSIKKQKSASQSTQVDQNAVGHLSGLFKNDPYA